MEIRKLGNGRTGTEEGKDSLRFNLKSDNSSHQPLDHLQRGVRERVQMNRQHAFLG